MGITGVGKNSSAFYNSSPARRNQNSNSETDSFSEMLSEKNEGTNENRKTVSVTELLKMYEELHKLTAQKLKEEKDWRDMSDDEWDKMLEGIDDYLDDVKERMEEKQKLQDEAAQKAALEASPEMRSIAASEAALNVAANGSSSGIIPEGEKDSDNQKDWTKNLNTENQTILRTAKAVQDMEKMAMAKYREAMLTSETMTEEEKKEVIADFSIFRKDDEE